MGPRPLRRAMTLAAVLVTLGSVMQLAPMPANANPRKSTCVTPDQVKAMTPLVPPGRLSYVDLPAGVVFDQSCWGRGPGIIDNADGQNYRVWIHVRGSGLTVNTWWTTVTQYYSDGCLEPEADFLYNGNYWWIDPSGPPCHTPPPGGETIWTGYAGNLPHAFSQNTQVCNDWFPNPPLKGNPCETIHS